MESQESKCEESENKESESEEGDESEFEPLAKRPCSTRSGRDASSGRVSYSSSVSTFCRNEIKDRNNYKSLQQHIFISFSFSGKKWLACPMLDVFFVGNFHRLRPPKL